MEVLGAFLRLGLTSFGGPVAHLGYFREELVRRRSWVDEQTYADMVALCQFLPGPASSQVGITLGTARAGMLGGLAAWVGFTLPSALAMAAFALGMGALGGAGAGWLHGLKVVAVAVVAQAIWGMASRLCPDRARASLAIAAAALLLAWPSALSQVVAILAGAIFGWRFLAGPAPAGGGHALRLGVPRGVAVACWALLAGLLVGLPLLQTVADSPALALFAGFFRAGALVFGGGHVVLPLLQEVVVPPGWVTPEQFIAGYGAAQAVPGPLFTFSAYLGAASAAPPGGWAGAALALVAVFLPSFLLVWGALPFWDALRARADAQAALRGVNAAVVGILIAALYTPVFTSAVAGPLDLALALAAFALLQLWKAPPWAVVALCAIGGAAIGG
ncbi:chromate efflux transporter [Oscillochloris sp. ZM17-4]|nr:chromate efflux transporter [Oscillochloris sp. ZM17-4]MBX0329382.1 chromate efflux transporter [Oscillochloris sp. ZM17-4]